MGTRADFYVKDGPTLTAASWLGSTGFNGHPVHQGTVVRAGIRAAKTEGAFRAAVTSIASKADDFTSIDEGWPWPWKDSTVTDYAYVFDVALGRVVVYCFGRAYPEDADSAAFIWPPDAPAFEGFPDMRTFANVQFSGPKSGTIVDPRDEGER